MTENETVSLCLMKEKDMKKVLASVKYALGVVSEAWRDCRKGTRAKDTPHEAERLRAAYRGLSLMLDSVVTGGRIIIPPLEEAFPELTDAYREFDEMMGEDYTK